MKQGLSIYKFEKLSVRSILNAIRLHLDSILLFNNQSYPSSFQLSVIALEEIAKSNWLDHYVFTSRTNNGFPDVAFEQEWLQLLFIHSKKQFAFINQEFQELSPKFYEFVASNNLELKKQKATYVGLERNRGKVNINSRISIPTQIKMIDAKQIISLNNDVLLAICKNNIDSGHYYGPYHKYQILNQDISDLLNIEWTSKSGLRRGRNKYIKKGK